MSDRELRIRRRLKDDFPFYAKKCLKIRAEDKKLIPFELNETQQYIHEKIEEQKAKTGMVRALILKGRKQGASTYIAGRDYHQTTHNRGHQTVIMAHEQTASATLFEIAKRFHDHCPPIMQPVVGRSSTKELYFPVLDSGYQVLTAGSTDVGRSKTPTNLHGSEAAFWKNAATHMAGITQAVPYAEDTEIIFESTANGIGGTFHMMWQNAEAGIGDYIAIFAPWFWKETNRRKVLQDLDLSEEDKEYQRLYELDDEQMAWRQNKIIELGDESLFKQEYPATAAEAFQATGHDSYINPEDIMKARKADLDGIGPLIVGVDPARSEKKGADRFGIMRRRGRKMFGSEGHLGLSIPRAAHYLKDIIDHEAVAKMFIDAGGLGIGVIDTLHEMGAPYDKIVVGVNFGGKPLSPPRFSKETGEKLPHPKNRRAEMYKDAKEWLQDEAGADIPDSDELHADAVACGYDENPIRQELTIESKKQIKKKGLRSPDLWDAAILTLARPVGNASSSKAAADAIAAAKAQRKTGWMGR